MMFDRYKSVKKSNMYKLEWYMKHLGMNEVVLCSG